MSLLTPLVNKVYKAATTPDARGMLASSFSNYLRNYYGPSAKTKEVAEKVGDVVGPVGSKTVMGGAKAAGFLEGGLEGLTNFIKMQDPYNAAAYRSGGINRPTLETAPRKDYTANVQGAKNPEEQAIARQEEEFIARGIGSTSHQGEQSGREGVVAPTLKELQDKMSFGGYKVMEPDFYKSALKYQNKSVTGQEATKEDAKYIEEYMMDTWKQRTLTQRILNKMGAKLEGTPFKYDSSNKFILKVPSSKKTGNHKNDMLGKKSPLRKAALEVFKDGNPNSVQELAKRLEDTGVVNIKKIDKDGVWVNFSMTGSGITEGGVNYLVKIKRDGKGFGVMSDEHDFLEFAPPVRALVNKRLLAATPPMNFNLKRQYKNELAGGRGRKTKVQEETNPRLVERRGQKWDEFGQGRFRESALKEYVDPEILKQEQIKAILKAVGIGGAGYQTMKED